MTGTNPSRRRFVRTLAAGTAGAAIGLPAKSYARILGANDRVGVGMIGMGRMARGHLNTLVSEPGAQVLALCDVYEPNLRYAARSAPEAQTYGDLRRVLDRADVDAVVVATPDHWHALATIMACDAGKDVYVEKPSSVTIGEGRKMVEAARRHNRVVQVGTQQRSGAHFQYAVEIVRSGMLGPVSFVRTWNYSNDYPDGIGAPPDSDPPPGLDWDLWLGPAPNVPFNPNRFGVFLDENLAYARWANFRWFWHYAGGMMTDWGVHLLDVVQWAMDVAYPEAVAAMGGKFYLTDNRETPDTLQATFRYPTFVCTYENRVCNARPMDGHGYGILFHGAAGTLYLDRSGLEIMPEPGSDVLPAKIESVGGDHARHVRNFLACVRSREKPISDIEVGHRSSSTAMLGNIAYRTGRQLAWDGANEQVVDDPEANRYLLPQTRGPWTL